MTDNEQKPESYEDLPGADDEEGVPEGYCPYCTYKPCQGTYNGCKPK